MVVRNGMHFHLFGYLYTVCSVNSTNNVDFSFSKCTIIVVTVQANIRTILDDHSNSILTIYGFQDCST